jgi:hypothetical protein
MRRIAAIVGGLAIAAALAACSGEGYGQGQSERSEQGGQKQAGTLDEASRTGLTALRQLAATPNFRALGFTSSEEAARAQLGPRYEVFVIGLDALRAYRPEAPADSLLVASSETVFPVLVDGQVRSSMTVTRTPQGFAPTAFGAAAMIRSTMGARGRAEGDFLVRVPALGLQFIGSRAEGRLLLTAVVADPRLQLPPGRPVPAETVLGQLVPLARAQNDLPI